MKICGIVCEYNPFHLGHEYQLAEAKKRSGADTIVCVLSEYFTQRGEAAVLPARVRAKHAVLCGADAVIALPAVFSSSSAEVFARGAIRLLCSILGFDCLSFGAEHAESDFYAAAEILNDERAYMAKTKEFLSRGFSFAAARAEALKDSAAYPLLSSPNDILGLEYARALLKEHRRESVALLPIARKGEYKNSALTQSGAEEYSSATAIRGAIEKGDFAALSSELPACVYEDIKSAKLANEILNAAEKIAVLTASESELARTADISEGLENALKKAVKSQSDVIAALTSKRYTASRIRRILLQNLLKIQKELVLECLAEPLYIKPLAVKKERKDLLAALSSGAFPCVLRYADKQKLSGATKRCFETDKLAENIYSAVTGFYGRTKEIFY